MSSISRSRSSPYSKYKWASVDSDLSGRSLSPKAVQKGLAGKKQGLALDKASLLDVLLDKKAANRPSQAQPANRQPRWSNDKDEFRSQDTGTKGMPVRLSSADPKHGAGRTRESQEDRWKASQWFADGFDEPGKRTT